MLWNPPFLIIMLDFEFGTPSRWSPYKYSKIWNTRGIWNTVALSIQIRDSQLVLISDEVCLMISGADLSFSEKENFVPFLLFMGRDERMARERGGSLSDTSWCRCVEWGEARAPGLEGGAGGGLPAGVTLCSLLSIRHTGAQKALTILLNQDEKEMKSYLLL